MDTVDDTAVGIDVRVDVDVAEVTGVTPDPGPAPTVETGTIETRTVAGVAAGADVTDVVDVAGGSSAVRAVLTTLAGAPVAVDLDALAQPVRASTTAMP